MVSIYVNFASLIETTNVINKITINNFTTSHNLNNFVLRKINCEEAFCNNIKSKPLLSTERRICSNHTIIWKFASITSVETTSIICICIWIVINSCFVRATKYRNFATNFKIKCACCTRSNRTCSNHITIWICKVNNTTIPAITITVNHINSIDAISKTKDSRIYINGTSTSIYFNTVSINNSPRSFRCIRTSHKCSCDFCI